jgi:elongation factor G
VDDGSTVTDFLPAERARGITIQSAAITFQWPPEHSKPPTIENAPLSALPHTINLIDTPGHADFTFEVLRSLRVLDGAVCILDGVAGVEAQTEMVWDQAGHNNIPRLIYVNKLDRDGASFTRTVKEIAAKLSVWPAVCHVPWWIRENGSDVRFCGVGDVVNLRSLRWEPGSNGRAVTVHSLAELQQVDPALASDIKQGRTALVELLSEHDDAIVDHFLRCDEDHLAISPSVILESLRKCSRRCPQAIVPVFAGASFRNIGVQPLLDAVVDLLPSPAEKPATEVTIDGVVTRLQSLDEMSLAKQKKHVTAISKLQACAIAFKVVHDQKRGVLVYVRVYHGSLERGCHLFNTTLGLPERAIQLLRMYASDAAEIASMDAGSIGVIVGMKHARTGDTLISCFGSHAKTSPPAPLNKMQLRPINAPPPVFFASIEPYSLSEEKNVLNALQILLREDPSLHLSTDPESGQTLLSGMGELHLDIACDRLIRDLKAKASVGKIEISYREAVLAASGRCEFSVDREIAGKRSRAACTVEVGPLASDDATADGRADEHWVKMEDENVLGIHVFSRPRDDAKCDHTFNLPDALPKSAILTAVRAGAAAALARGPHYGLPLQSTRVRVSVNAATDVFADSSPAAVAEAARRAVQAALRRCCDGAENALLEPVMHVAIDVHERDLGGVLRDLTAARGANVLSLGSEDAVDAGDAAANIRGAGRAADPAGIDLKKVYAPRDPYHSSAAGDAAQVATEAATHHRKRQIVARVPLREMVGYLKHLRSLTGGRGTFLMSVDRFEPVRGQRLKRAAAEIRGF